MRNERKGPSFLSERRKKTYISFIPPKEGTSKRPSITGFAPASTPLLPPLQSQRRKMNEEGGGIEGGRKKSHLPLSYPKLHRGGESSLDEGMQQVKV